MNKERQTSSQRGTRVDEIGEMVASALRAVKSAREAGKIPVLVQQRTRSINFRPRSINDPNHTIFYERVNSHVMEVEVFYEGYHFDTRRLLSQIKKNGPIGICLSDLYASARGQAPELDAKLRQMKKEGKIVEGETLRKEGLSDFDISILNCAMRKSHLKIPIKIDKEWERKEPIYYAAEFMKTADPKFSRRLR